MCNAWISCYWNSHSECSNTNPWYMYYTGRKLNGPLLRILVNGSAIFPSEWKMLIFNFPSSTQSRKKWWNIFMSFFRWDDDMLSNNNIDALLLKWAVTGYLSTTSIKNKITQINSILKYTSVTAEYWSSVTNSVTASWLHKCHAVNNPLSRVVYPVTFLRLSLSTA